MICKNCSLKSLLLTQIYQLQKKLSGKDFQRSNKQAKNEAYKEVISIINSLE